MLSAFAALLASIPPVAAAAGPTLGQNPWLVATVGHSEFCPVGNVRLDLRTGRYDFTARAPRRMCDQVSERPVRRGTLDSKRLAAVRAAALRVLAEGFESSTCRAGNPPEDITISNGGTPTVVVTTGFATATALDDLSCWSEAATALHDLLDETFASEE